MKLSTSVALLAALSCFTNTFVLDDGRAPSPTHARLIPAEIRVDGEVVLRGSTSDDGHPDVDAVWDYQRGTLAYAPTAAFAALGVPADTEEWVLEPRPTDRGERSESAEGAKADDPKTAATKPRRRRPAQWTIEVVVGYGGEARTHSLRLVRGKQLPTGGEWYVHPDDVDRLFGSRLIRREAAAQLEEPARRK